MHAPLIILGTLLAGSSPLAQELSEETFQTWYSAILPKGQDLAWREISWRGTLGEGLREAQKRDLPLLFWAMNGHPLDCT